MVRALVLALLVGVAAVAAGCSETAGLGGEVDQRLRPVAERAPAPRFSVPRLTGEGAFDLAERRGRPVLLNFWASWCDPCRREMPALAEFAREHPEIDVVGLAVNDRPDDSRRFADRVGARFDLGIDRRGDVAADFDVPGLPVTVVIYRQGRVASNHVGPIDRAQLDSYADQLGS
ncbi:TlpA family protein disulfide reductase [Miltoncostaea marina]|uniref:TlpA family protein disulfide reductase n=1 Tax=Miltoncostaea marina TaxID=2843215 RepID=UPI001C3D13BA|nr:TlpA disulfide reductase family protein [Miltoncostaea marina]